MLPTSPPAVAKNPMGPIEEGGQLKPTKVGASVLDTSSITSVLLVILLHQIEVKEQKQVLTGLQNQKGNVKLLIEKGELLQHLHWILGF
jgi:hypothetical protein